MENGVVDDIIRRLLEGKGGKQVQLSEGEIRQLCVNARQIFLSQPNFLQLSAPIRICGILTLSPSKIKYINTCVYIFNLLEFLVFGMVCCLYMMCILQVQLHNWSFVIIMCNILCTMIYVYTNTHIYV